MQTGEIWIIDNDIEDQEIVREVLKELHCANELVFIRSAEDTIMRLRKASEAPFLIICELNLPGSDGFELRAKLLESDSKKFKSVPFIFWSDQASESQITQAYELSVHGFFIKEGDFQELRDTFSYIIHYWTKSKMPTKTV